MEQTDHNDVEHAGKLNRTASECDPLLVEKAAARHALEPPGFFRNLGISEWSRSLLHHFGYKLLTLLFVCQHIVKGFVRGLLNSATPYLYKQYHVPGPQVQVYRGVTAIPWAMKPIIGLLSDILPVWGYNKAPYILLTTAIGCVALLYAGVTPTTDVPIVMLVICLFLASLQSSTCDLLSEAKYAEKIRANPSQGPRLMTYVWFGLQLFGLFAMCISGSVIAAGGPRCVIIICGCMTLMVLVPVGLGFMEEKKIDNEELARARANYMRQGEVCCLCLLMFVCSIALSVVGTAFHSPVVHCVVAIVVGIVILFAFSMVLSPVIAKFNAFALIQQSLSLPTTGAAFYFYTDTPEQYPAGPHFSPLFYNTVLGIMAAAFSLVGILLYQRYFARWKYRNMWIMTNLVYSSLATLDVLMFARVNKRFGIPDHVLILGLAASEEMVNQWQWMPQVVILSHLCPKGMEATMYALLAGCHNLGSTIAANCGALLLTRLGCSPSGSINETAQFEHLWVAAAISTVLPMVAILLLVPLVPNATQSEQLISDSENDATTGSIWKRYFKRE